MSLSHEQVKEALPNILQHIPQEWRGTTYNNSNLLGRERFAQNLTNLILTKKTEITTQDLVELGNAEDYLRVSSNVSSVLEFVLANQRGFDISRVFTFASQVMPIFAILLEAKETVHLYVGENGNTIFTPQNQELLQKIGCKLQIHQSTPEAHPDGIVLSTVEDFQNQNADALVLNGVLYILKTEKIESPKLLIVRKRMSTPFTTPVALQKLQDIATGTTHEIPRADTQGINSFLAHLQTMSGTVENPQAYPQVFTAGLPAICSLWLTLIAKGGADIVMASTAYGGSSQLTDLFHNRGTGLLNKHTYDITGKNDLVGQIELTFNELASKPQNLLPITMLFVEIPTNPDMKVPDLKKLIAALLNYKKQTGKEVVILIDTTFGPQSKVLGKIEEYTSDLTTLAFISLSKSVSRGLTTGGTIVAGPSNRSQAFLARLAETRLLLDTSATQDQLQILADNHTGVEERNINAYNVAKASGEALQAAVKQYANGYDMEIHFPTKEQAADGFTSSTFAFNLPPLENVDASVNEGLAQRFVDLLVVHKEFKPCVSFGQDNGLVYSTVPATSTQGAIKLEDKAKQAVGGVQLVRLSFPPTIDVEAVKNALTEGVRTIYTN